MEKAQKIQILKQYFDADKTLETLILCHDGNVFYKEGKSFCTAHCRQNKVKSETVTRQEYNDLVKEAGKEGKESEAKKKGRPWAVSKGFDTFCPIGPVIVTSEEIPDPHVLNLQLLVNKEVRQQGNTKDMIFKVDQIISYCSSIFTLNTGDIIATGTPEGVNAFTKGDYLKASIDEIGTLEIGVK